VKKMSIAFHCLSTALILLLSVQNYQLKHRPSQPMIADQRVDVPTGDAPSLGRPDAPVTIVAFSSFTCGFCADAADALYRLHERYPDRVRVVFRHATIDNGATAALLAVAAREQGFFWEMHDVLFAHDAEIGSLSFAELIPGLDTERLRADMQRPEINRQLTDDRDIARALGVTATPTLFVNGIRMQGVTLEALERLVTAEFERLGLDPTS